MHTVCIIGFLKEQKIKEDYTYYDVQNLKKIWHGVANHRSCAVLYSFGTTRCFWPCIMLDVRT